MKIVMTSILKIIMNCHFERTFVQTSNCPENHLDCITKNALLWYDISNSIGIKMHLKIVINIIMRCFS